MLVIKKPYRTIKECAAESGISSYWWRKAVKNNEVPYMKSGTKYYIDLEAAIAKIRNGEFKQ